MSDLISREDALSKFEKACTFESVDKNGMKRGEIKTALTWEGIRKILENIPSAEPEPEEFEWCTDCKEYDQEQHCCHRWTKVIRQTVEEVKSQYALGNQKIIHCEDCKWWDRLEEGHPYGDCRACRSGTQTKRWDIHIQRQCKFDFYCADAEPIEDEVTDDQA